MADSFPFLIHDFTPRDRSRFPQRQADARTEWTGIAKVVIGVHDLDAAIARYQKAYGLPPSIRRKTLPSELSWHGFQERLLYSRRRSQQDSWLSAALATSSVKRRVRSFSAPRRADGSTVIAWFDADKARVASRRRTMKLLAAAI